MRALLGCAPARLALCLALAWAGVPLAASAQDAGSGIRVRYRSADTVYLDAGERAGLSVGDRLELRREGESVAVIELVFVAGSSSSARVVEEKLDILPGDLALPLGELRPPRPAEEKPPPASASEPRDRSAPPDVRYPTRRERRTRLTGVVSLDVESRTTERGRDTDLTTGRLSLRGRDLGGLPLDLRVRLRSRQVERSGDLGAGIPSSEDRDRLYELSLRWTPDSERWSVELGRLGAGPFSGIGYLDGASGRARIAGGWEVGAFYGRRPELGELGFDSGGTKYGIFSRWSADDAPWEVFVAGVEEEDDRGASRRLAVLESRLARPGGRWSLYQRAEIDLALDDLAGDESSGRLTQAALALSGELGERSRLVISYDRYDPLLLFEDRDPGPAQRFEDLLRQGLRARVIWGKNGGLGMSLTAGLRSGEGMAAGGDERTYSAGLGVHSSRARGLSWNGDLLAFSNPFTEGALLTLRARHGFSGGHSLGLAVGSTAYSEELTGLDRASSWARVDGWVELPASLFARGELELTTGDDAEGQRLRLGLGYRF